MRLLVSIFLYGFLLDAALSVAGEWLSIGPLHAVVAWSIFGLGLVLYVLAAFTPRLPKRLLLPPVIFLVWTNICGAFPLAFIAPAHLWLALSLGQLIFAMGLLLVHRRGSHTPPPVEAPGFSWRTFALVTLPSLAAIPLILAAALINMTGRGIETKTGGYVKLRPSGLLMEERAFAKNGQQVRLVSMMHIGEKNFYDRIHASLPAQSTSVVLIEGVTDEKGLISGRFSYAKIAEMFGLTSQEKSALQEEGKSSTDDLPPATTTNTGSKVQYRRADVDISSFDPLTLDFINTIGIILADPTATTILRTLRDPSSPLQQPEADTVVMHDILDKRNEHLITEIDRALETSQIVVVPWGAMHLPAIESALADRGFKETHRIDRPIIRFWRGDEAPPGK